MKKLRWFAITLFLLSVVLYALDQNQIRRKTDQTIPKISMDQDEIQVSVKDPEKVWKKGITAYDEKDGDITDSLVIESVSTFLEKGRRLVSYAAFDRDGHVAKASRQLIYTDYHSPKISCAKPFSFPVGTQDILDSVYATDCIDGDISNKVEITGDSVFFLNIAGGLKVNDPAIDLAVISSILSSSLDISIEPGVCMAGEVGLSGEIRPVNRIEQRILEAEKLGFSRIIIPHNNLKGFDTAKSKIQIVQVKKVEEAFRQLFG